VTSKIPSVTRITGTVNVPQKRKVPRLARVPHKSPVYGVVLSDCVFGFDTHYAGGRTVLCPGQEECEFCGKVKRQWIGLIAIAETTQVGYTWYQLTDLATGSLFRQLEEMQRPLFKCVLRLTRARPANNAPIVVSIDQYASSTCGVRNPVTPDDTLELVFNSPKSPPKKD